MRPLLVLGLAATLGALAGCQREPAKATKAPSPPGAAQPRPFVGRVFKADYSGALCHRTPTDWLPREGEARSPSPREQEPSILASTQGRARRDGGVLTVSGARFADNAEEGDASVTWAYAGRLPTAPFDVVHGTHWEWLTWNLVDAKGAWIDLSGPPVVSPDGRAFAAAGDDVEGETLNGVEIATYAKGVFDRVTLDVLAACDPRWIDNDTLEVKVLPEGLRGVAGTAGTKPSDWKTTRIVRDGKGWKPVPPVA